MSPPLPTAAEVEQDAQRVGLVIAALIVGWTLICVGYVVQLQFPKGSLLEANLGTSAAASGFWLAFVLFTNALSDLLGLKRIADLYEGFMRWLVQRRFFRSRWLPHGAMVLGLLIGRFLLTRVKW